MVWYTIVPLLFHRDWPKKRAAWNGHRCHPGSWSGGQTAGPGCPPTARLEGGDYAPKRAGLTIKNGGFDHQKWWFHGLTWFNHQRCGLKHQKWWSQHQKCCFKHQTCGFNHHKWWFHHPTMVVEWEYHWDITGYNRITQKITGIQPPPKRWPYFGLGHRKAVERQWLQNGFKIEVIYIIKISEI